MDAKVAMGRILFSLPVTERPDIVRQQIENINYFCPGSLICIHIAAGASAGRSEFERSCDFENVVINPYSYVFAPGAGMLHLHVSNFLHMLETGSEFDTVMLISADELLIKHGFSEHVSKHPIGAQTEVFDLATDWGVFREDLLKSTAMQGFLSGVELPLYFGGQSEGQFFKRAIFSQLTRLFIANFPMAPCGFPIEEIVPSTIAARHSFNGMDIAQPATLCDYCTRLVVTEEILAQVLSGKGSIFADRLPDMLRSPHMGVSVLRNVFSVKIGPRIKWDIRAHIRGMMT
jgi:hypothetical protein